LARGLVSQGVLDSIIENNYPLLRLNEQSYEVLGQRLQVLLPDAPKREKVLKPGRDGIPLTFEEQGLFQQLRHLRMVQAQKEGIPPYMVFADSTLQELARQRPINQDQMQGIFGVGQRKLEVYGEIFTREIQVYCEANGLKAGLVPEIVEPVRKSRQEREPREAKTPTYMITFELYQQGMTVQEISQERGMVEGTIVGHLITLMETGVEVNISNLVSPERYQMVLQAIQQIGDETLKPIKDLLPEDYTYAEIRIVRAIERQK
jgi:ATP-dependent DNA helicase RecQ